MKTVMWSYDSLGPLRGAWVIGEDYIHITAPRGGWFTIELELE